jgi:8-oxo-dGTP diphosphatase
VSGAAAIPVVSAILANGKGKVLMQLRDDRPDLEYPAHWTLPGGYVEEDETPGEAIRRELREEMELDIPLVYRGSHRAQRGPGGSVTVEQHLYVGRLDTPVDAIPLHEGQALRYVSARELEGLLIAFDHRATLERYFGGETS